MSTWTLQIDTLWILKEVDKNGPGMFFNGASQQKPALSGYINFGDFSDKDPVLHTMRAMRGTWPAGRIFRKQLSVTALIEIIENYDIAIGRTYMYRHDLIDFRDTTKMASETHEYWLTNFLFCCYICCCLKVKPLHKTSHEIARKLTISLQATLTRLETFCKFVVAFCTNVVGIEASLWLKHYRQT